MGNSKGKSKRKANAADERKFRVFPRRPLGAVPDSPTLLRARAGRLPAPLPTAPPDPRPAGPRAASLRLETNRCPLLPLPHSRIHQTLPTRWKRLDFFEDRVAGPKLGTAGLPGLPEPQSPRPDQLPAWIGETSVPTPSPPTPPGAPPPRLRNPDRARRRHSLIPSRSNNHCPPQPRPPAF